MHCHVNSTLNVVHLAAGATAYLKMPTIPRWWTAAILKIDISPYLSEQELSYSKQIARKQRTYTIRRGHHRHSVTLKSTLRVTQGHWKRTIGQIIHDLLLDELLDVEYYRDLEMWVKGQ